MNHEPHGIIIKTYYSLYYYLSKAFFTIFVVLYLLVSFNPVNIPSYHLILA